ncbi:MAG: hypothetical protein WC342_07675 [Methanoregula sp.]|jgi:hypothetical protein
MDNRISPATCLRKNCVILTLIAVWIVIILAAVTRVPFAGQNDPARIFSYVLTVVAFSAFISIIPASVILVGWFTKNPIGAGLFGIFLLPALVVAGYLLTSGKNIAGITTAGMLVFYVIPSVLSGGAGYCAARQTKSGLAVAIILGGIWALIMMHAFN